MMSVPTSKVLILQLDRPSIFFIFVYTWIVLSRFYKLRFYLYLLLSSTLNLLLTSKVWIESYYFYCISILQHSFILENCCNIWLISILNGQLVGYCRLICNKSSWGSCKWFYVVYNPVSFFRNFLNFPTYNIFHVKEVVLFLFNLQLLSLNSLNFIHL